MSSGQPLLDRYYASNYQMIAYTALSTEWPC
jgi:hypothetical protein